MLVVATTLAGIKAHEQFVAIEDFWPLLQRIQVIQSHSHALLERPDVFVARCEIRRKQDSADIEIRENLAEAINLLW